MYRLLASSSIAFALIFLAIQTISIGSKVTVQSDSIQKGLLQAGRNCDRELASILIARGANPNLPSEAVQPLTRAIARFNLTINLPPDVHFYTTTSRLSKEQRRQKCLDFINYFLENEADPNLLFTPPDGRVNEFTNVAPSAFFQAVNVNSGLPNTSNTQAIEALLNNGANPNLGSLHEYKDLAIGSTPLMVIMKESQGSRSNVQKVWDILLPISDVNLRNNDGETALMILVQYDVGGQQFAVQRLLDAGARTDIKNAEGLTALDIAISEGKTNIVKLLIQ